MTTTPISSDPPRRALLLRTCRADMKSHGGFVWPTCGPVTAPDWDPANVCGRGLHGLLWGEGDGSLLCWSPDARWLVLAADAASIVDLDGKVKCPIAEVVYCGDRAGAIAFLLANGAQGRAVVGAQVVAGDRGTATAGYRGTATAGYRGTATVGDRGTATAGRCGTATAGEYGAATAGEYGTATAGYRGTATAGRHGTAIAGYRGTSAAGDRGCLVLSLWDGSRRRVHVAYVGEDGIKPNVAYRLDKNGAFVEAYAL